MKPEAELFQRLLDALEAHETRLTAYVASLGGLSLNAVLRSEQLRLGATLGHAHRESSVPFASIGVWAYDSDVTVAAGPTQKDTPDIGVGVFKVPSGKFALLPLAGVEVSLYGSVSALVWLGMWSAPQVPTVSGSGASAIDGGGA